MHPIIPCSDFIEIRIWKFSLSFISLLPFSPRNNIGNEVGSNFACTFNLFQGLPRSLLLVYTEDLFWYTLVSH
jgi:hypothetical protein